MSPSAKKQYSDISDAILELLKASPVGLDIHQLREHLKEWGPQQHLDRRLRELDPHFIILRRQEGRRKLYQLNGKRPPGSWDYQDISKELRAQALDSAKGRCQMCGRTIKDDRVRLHIDHKIPRSWGGSTTKDNLWAICSACNEGKKDYYATFSPDLMGKVLSHEGVHNRIAYLLKSKIKDWVDRDLIEFVANFEDYQEDWHKRLRELRYLDFVINVKKEKIDRRTVSFYSLQNWIEYKEDLGVLAKRYEAKKSKERRNTQ